jgi:hypothetical protein
MSLLGAVAVALAVLVPFGAVAQSVKPTVIELTQVACQVLESEDGVNRGY